MTPTEAKILTYMVMRSERGIASWSELRHQFCLSEGGLTTLINSLKRHMQVQQDGLYYKITSVGKTALEAFQNPRRPEPFVNAREW